MAQGSGSQKRRHSRIGYLEHPDDDTVTLRAFWSPVPSWTIGVGSGLIVGAIAALALLAAGDSSSAVGAFAIGFGAGYFGGAIAWAVVGAFGGDVLRVRFDLANETAHVHQSLFWVVQRDWSFSLEESASLHIWAKKGFGMQRLAPTHVVALSRFNQPALQLGMYPSRIEADEIVRPLGTALELPVRENAPPPVGG
jgi:hypothetical protein